MMYQFTLRAFKSIQFLNMLVGFLFFVITVFWFSDIVRSFKTLLM